MKPPYLPHSQRSELKAITAITKPRLRSYILRPDGRIRQVSVMHAALWQEAGNGRIALTRLSDGARQVEVSTVFISVPVPLLFSRHPRFFETMVFYNNDMDGDRWLYDTLEDAVLGHMEIVEKIQARRPVC